MSKSKGISPSASSSSPYFVKREESTLPIKKRAPSIGSGGRRSINEARAPPSQSEVLDAILPGMKGSLFSPEVNNLTKAKELKRLLNCLGDWGSINVSNL